MEPVGAFDLLIKQGPLIAFMCLVIFYGAKYIKSTLEAAEKREAEREARYNTMTDAMLTLSTKQTETVTTALVGNTEVLKRVERKLDEDPAH